MTPGPNLNDTAPDFFAQPVTLRLSRKLFKTKSIYCWRLQLDFTRYSPARDIIFLRENISKSIRKGWRKNYARQKEFAATMKKCA